jgi:hypothetical protein
MRFSDVRGQLNSGTDYVQELDLPIVGKRWPLGTESIVCHRNYTWPLLAQEIVGCHVYYAKLLLCVRTFRVMVYWQDRTRTR